MTIFLRSYKEAHDSRKPSAATWHEWELARRRYHDVVTFWGQQWF